MLADDIKVELNGYATIITYDMNDNVIDRYHASAHYTGRLNILSYKHRLITVECGKACIIHRIDEAGKISDRLKRFYFDGYICILPCDLIIEVDGRHVTVWRYESLKDHRLNKISQWSAFSQVFIRQMSGMIYAHGGQNEVAIYNPTTNLWQEYRKSLHQFPIFILNDGESAVYWGKDVYYREVFKLGCNQELYQRYVAGYNPNGIQFRYELDPEHGGVYLNRSHGEIMTWQFGVVLLSSINKDDKNDDIKRIEKNGSIISLPGYLQDVYKKSKHKLVMMTRNTEPLLNVLITGTLCYPKDIAKLIIEYIFIDMKYSLEFGLSND